MRHYIGFRFCPNPINAHINFWQEFRQNIFKHFYVAVVASCPELDRFIVFPLFDSGVATSAAITAREGCAPAGIRETVPGLAVQEHDALRYRDIRDIVYIAAIQYE